MPRTARDDLTAATMAAGSSMVAIEVTFAC
jgi:hypothetical protein